MFLSMFRINSVKTFQIWKQNNVMELYLVFSQLKPGFEGFDTVVHVGYELFFTL
jgi:hypothetical protein